MDIPFNDRSTLTNRDISSILHDVNVIRMTLLIGEGKLSELPKGIKSNPEQCVLARALSNGWRPQIDDAITLFHDGDAPIDFEKAVKALRNHGFEAEVVSKGHDPRWLNGDLYYDDPDEYYRLESLPAGVRIELSPEMNMLIEQFDGGLLPELVLKSSY